MRKQVYISADYDRLNGDQDVVNELNKWGNDSLHKVDFIDMSKVSSGSVANGSNCRICDLKDERRTGTIYRCTGNGKERTDGKTELVRRTVPAQPSEALGSVFGKKAIRSSCHSLMKRNQNRTKAGWNRR